MKDVAWLDPQEITRNLEPWLLRITELMKADKQLRTFLLVKNPVRNWHFFLCMWLWWNFVFQWRSNVLFKFFLMNSSGLSTLTHTSHNASGNSPMILSKFLMSFSPRWIKPCIFGSDSPSVRTGAALMIQSVKPYQFTLAQNLTKNFRLRHTKCNSCPQCYWLHGSEITSHLCNLNLLQVADQLLSWSVLSVSYCPNKKYPTSIMHWELFFSACITHL